jgi:hypothetical protein
VRNHTISRLAHATTSAPAPNQLGDDLPIRRIARQHLPADGKALVDPHLDLLDGQRIDHQGLDPSRAIVVHLCAQGRAGGGQAVHLAQRPKPHIGRQRRLHGLGQHTLVRIVDRPRRCDANHLDGAVVLGLDLDDFAIELHSHIHLSWWRDLTTHCGRSSRVQVGQR